LRLFDKYRDGLSEDYPAITRDCVFRQIFCSAGWRIENLPKETKRNIITDILKAGGTRVINVSFDIKIED